MFTIEGTLRITDLAREISHASEITRDGHRGTAPTWPEQALRNETSPRSDIFAVGIVCTNWWPGAVRLPRQ